MSFIVKGIDLPKADEIHRLIVLPTGQVIEDKKTYYNEYEAIQIPKDHGNIIDESKAVVTETIDGYYEITAPTILEAEDL